MANLEMGNQVYTEGKEVGRGGGGGEIGGVPAHAR